MGVTLGQRQAGQNPSCWVFSKLALQLTGGECPGFREMQVA